MRPRTLLSCRSRQQPERVPAGGLPKPHLKRYYYWGPGRHVLRAGRRDDNDSSRLGPRASKHYHADVSPWGRSIPHPPKKSPMKILSFLFLVAAILAIAGGLYAFQQPPAVNVFVAN